ncbi:phospholipase D-like domain-containing protein [Bacillus sp. FJAT-45066]|uniref:phospholipase D-like domain-containing protein n=1 Tax=Bacillus sp. FJAT-45066 TaxID=2011010 RepID=UPI000BB8D62F|nr:phospholipase D-like domain-containing protein [Bacillus sp. FJAT-45066]
MLKRKTFSVLLSIFLLVSVIFPAYSFEANANEGQTLLITEVYYDTHLPFEPEEYVAITNTASTSIDLTGWRIGDGNHFVTFPNGTIIQAGETYYIVRDADAFMEQMVVDVIPNFEYGEDTVSSIPQMIGTVSPRFANNGDEVFLFNGDVLIDVVVYGSSSYIGDGWNSSPVPGVREGEILVRNQDEVTGEWIDTNSASDFISYRSYKAGQSRFETPTFEFEGSVTPYTSPDSSFEVLSELLDTAQYTIDLNLYEFHSPYLLDRVIAAIERGVQVRAFFEGSPVGGLQDGSKYVSQQIVQAGGEVRYIILDRDDQRYKRYRWNHAKYAVVDHKKIFVQSENWKKTGVPVNNSFGNRGWGIIIENPDVTAHFLTAFNTDWNYLYRDSFPYTPGHERYGEPSPGFEPDLEIPTGNYPALFPRKEITGSFKVTPILAPDSTFLMETSIIGMIRSAKDVVYVDQMYSHKYWGDMYGSPETDPNVYLEEVIDAARRGVTVRVSLGSSWLDPSNPRDNIHTVEYINTIAASEGLDMEAKLLDTTRTGLDKTHNKGVIADNKVLISSINWSANSPINNREAGIIIENVEVAQFYKDVFLWDYEGSLSGNEEIMKEDFETGSKTAYAKGNVQLGSGVWEFDNAILGSLASDKKEGNRAARIRSVGSISMLYDIIGAKSVSFSHANFGTDTGAIWQLQKSTDVGVTWVNVGEQMESTATLESYSVIVDENKPVRFRIIANGKTGSRINIDSFKVNY